MRLKPNNLTCVNIKHQETLNNNELATISPDINSAVVKTWLLSIGL